MFDPSIILRISDVIYQYSENLDSNLRVYFVLFVALLHSS
jgi:hypothetical protein